MCMSSTQETRKTSCKKLRANATSKVKSPYGAFAPAFA